MAITSGVIRLKKPAVHRPERGYLMEAVEQILMNQNTWVVCLLTGALLWVLRQLTPPSLEKSVYWKKVLRVIPLFLAAGLAAIPDLRPVPGSWVHSAGVGFIAGSFSQSIYDSLRDFAPKRFRALLGARAKRKEFPSPVGEDGARS